MDELGPVAWKQRAIEDFGRWLRHLPDDAPPASRSEEGQRMETAAQVSPAPLLPCPSADVPDLHSLYAALLALRQEVRLQNREQARSVRSLEKAVAASEAASQRLDEDRGELEAGHARAREETRHTYALALLDVRDALVRGRDAASAITTQRGWIRRPPAGIEGVVEGYDMALSRLDRTLESLGVVRVPTVGRRFDPTTMTALDSRSVQDAEDESVLGETRSGFLMNGSLLRAAEVTVNRR